MLTPHTGIMCRIPWYVVPVGLTTSILSAGIKSSAEMMLLSDYMVLSLSNGWPYRRRWADHRPSRLFPQIMCYWCSHLGVPSSGWEDDFFGATQTFAHDQMPHCGWRDQNCLSCVRCTWCRVQVCEETNVSFQYTQKISSVEQNQVNVGLVGALYKTGTGDVRYGTLTTIWTHFMTQAKLCSVGILGKFQLSLDPAIINRSSSVDRCSEDETYRHLW